MEINVGDYVRTKSGVAKYCGLGKDILKEIPNYNTHHHYDNQHIFDKSIFDVNHDYGDTLTNDEFVKTENTCKHSEDIIDLVQAGDIVTICDNFGGHKLETYMIDNNSKENCIDILKSIIDKSGYSIEKILTHEQFEANAYKIEKEV